MHPLAPNLSEMKDDELQKKYNDLMQKLNVAYRFGNHQLIWQMQALLEDYKEELSARQRKQFESNQDKHNLKDLVKINK